MCLLLRWVSNNGILSGALLVDPRDGQGVEKELLPCGGAFLAIGHKPMTAFMRGARREEEGEGAQVELDDSGYIVQKQVIWWFFFFSNLVKPLFPGRLAMDNKNMKFCRLSSRCVAEVPWKLVANEMELSGVDCVVILFRGNNWVLG